MNHPLTDKFPYPDNWGKLVGYEFIDHDPETGITRHRLVIQEHHLSPSGMTHGGVLSSFVDWSMGAAGFHALRPHELLSTIEFKINYLAPVQLGEELTCEVHLIFRGNSIAVFQYRVHTKDDRDVALGTGTYNLYTPSKPKE